MSSVLFAEALLPTRLRHALVSKTLTVCSREYNVVQKAGLELLGFERYEVGQALFASLPEMQREVCALTSCNGNQCIQMRKWRIDIITE